MSTPPIEPPLTAAQHLATLDPRPLDADVDVARLGRYRGYAEIVAALAALDARGAGAAVEVRAVGRSVGGAPLFAVELGPSSAPVTAAILAGIHPIEWIGVETGLALIDALLRSPPRDRRVIAFPLINVDGYRQVEADLRAGRKRWRRSNRRGVDLNRNWPRHWRRRRRGLIAGYNYGGPAPLSEPEVAAVVAALDAAAARAPIAAAVSLHSFGRVLLVPYGGRWRRPAGFAALCAAARAVQARVREPYTIRQSARWVPGAFARGMELDCLHDRYGAIAVLVECSRGGARATDPASWLDPFRWFNPQTPAPVAANLAAALAPLIRGTG